VATYNVENYGLANRRTADGYAPDYPKPESEKAALRRVIIALGPDVLALQEMGGPTYLRELQEDLRADGADYPAATELAAEDPARQVALLSKYPFRQVHGHRDLAFAYRGGTERVKRGLLEAVVATPQGDFTVFVVHLKSHLTERPDDPEARSGGSQKRRPCAPASWRSFRRRIPPASSSWETATTAAAAQRCGAWKAGGARYRRTATRRGQPRRKLDRILSRSRPLFHPGPHPGVARVAAGGGRRSRLDLRRAWSRPGERSSPGRRAIGPELAQWPPSTVTGIVTSPPP